MTNRFRRGAGYAAALLAFLAAGGAGAQAYPAKPTRHRDSQVGEGHCGGDDSAAMMKSGTGVRELGTPDPRSPTPSVKVTQKY
jgi:hypothetical protein